MVDTLSPVGAVTASGGARAPLATPAAEGGSFEQALGAALGSAIDAVQAGEGLALQGVQGAAPPMRVVEGVMEAQRSLQSVLSVRDKLVSAWQDVSRMAI